VSKQGRGYEEILREAKTIAVVGASRDEGKPSGSVPRTLQKRGFRVLPVNPKADTLLGVKSYASLADAAAAGESIDVVEVFRPSEEAAEVARQAVAAGARALWLQQGIRSEEARRIARGAGLDYVEDRCMAVDVAVLRIVKRSPTSA
jgi:predicted CoA-binding protein